MLDEDAELSVADESVVAASFDEEAFEDSEAVLAASLVVWLTFAWVEAAELDSLLLSDEEAADSEEAASEFEVSDSV